MGGRLSNRHPGGVAPGERILQAGGEILRRMEHCCRSRPGDGFWQPVRTGRRSCRQRPLALGRAVGGVVHSSLQVMSLLSGRSNAATEARAQPSARLSSPRNWAVSLQSRRLRFVAIPPASASIPTTQQLHGPHLGLRGTGGPTAAATRRFTARRTSLPLPRHNRNRHRPLPQTQSAPLHPRFAPEIPQNPAQ